MVDFTSVPLWLIFLGSLIAIAGASEIGIWVSRLAGGEEGPSISTLQSATLGMLALMVGFTFAMSLTRFEARRAAVLNEANAIGTVALRARLLPEPHATESLTLLQEYARLRLSITQRTPTAAEIDAVIERSDDIHEALWQHVIVLAQTNKELVPTGVYIEALNDMIDIQQTRLSAARGRVPNIVLLTIYVIAFVAAGFTGYVGGIKARESRIATYLMCVVVAVVILLLHDLDRSGAGFIRVSQQPMVDTADALTRYLDKT